MAWLYRSDEIFCLLTMGYREFLSGSEGPKVPVQRGFRDGRLETTRPRNINANDCVQRTPAGCALRRIWGGLACGGFAQERNQGKDSRPTLSRPRSPAQPAE